MARRLTMLWAVVVVLAVTACATDELTVNDVTEPERVPSRDSVLEDGGWPEVAAWVRRENAHGRPVLVNIFASWCDPCRREIPMLLHAADAHPDIAFLGVDHLDQRDLGQKFVDDLGITFPTIYDVAGDVAAAVHGRGMPTTVVFDADGVLVGHQTGELTDSSLQQLLDKVN